MGPSPNSMRAHSPLRKFAKEAEERILKGHDRTSPTHDRLHARSQHFHVDRKERRDKLQQDQDLENCTFRPNVHKFRAGLNQLSIPAVVQQNLKKSNTMGKSTESRVHKPKPNHERNMNVIHRLNAWESVREKRIEH